MAGFTGDWERFLPQSRFENFNSRFAAPFAGQVVCVAGAGGYIGSALVKTLAAEDLRSLILIDSSEHGLFEIQRYLAAWQPDLDCHAILGSVGDNQLLNELFTSFRPEVVFHTAAFKHVGLLEQNPFAAIENNVLGTYALAEAALRHGVSKFVMVSTDKAVRPHSVMGVSKRIAELITLSLSGPAFRANIIRLGNVIGSTGSVVPIFREQIEKGGPISVTHAEASRYFLTTDEAVSAILAGGAAVCEGKILLPDLGESVRIAELAGFLASRSFKSDGGTLPIRFIGLRPGEKLREDLIGEAESVVGAIDGPLTVVKTQRVSRADCDEVIERLTDCIAERDRADLLETLRAIVPEYVPSVLIRERAAAANQG
jgi:FlaA1/EpsC-like NDP-sugar epimerase